MALAVTAKLFETHTGTETAAERPDHEGAPAAPHLVRGSDVEPELYGVSSINNRSMRKCGIRCAVAEFTTKYC